MRLSEERKQRLYEAISGPLMELRLENMRATLPPDRNELDALLFDLEQDIWRNVAGILGVTA